MTYKCRICAAELNEDNWHPSLRKSRNYICKKCHFKRVALWRKANPDKCRDRLRAWRNGNPEKYRAQSIRSDRKRGKIPMNENRSCSSFLGVCVAERVLSHVFRDVERMPYGHSGYDFICNHGKKIDVKSSCIGHRSRHSDRWTFNINYNSVADYFLCIAFDNRDDLNPLHLWLLPTDVVGNVKCASILVSKVSKWDEYKIDISRVLLCCETLKREE